MVGGGEGRGGGAVNAYIRISPFAFLLSWEMGPERGDFYYLKRITLTNERIYLGPVIGMGHGWGVDKSRMLNVLC